MLEQSQTSNPLDTASMSTALYKQLTWHYQVKTGPPPGPLSLTDLTQRRVALGGLERGPGTGLVQLPRQGGPGFCLLIVPSTLVVQ